MTIWEFLISPPMLAVFIPAGLFMLACLLWAICEAIADRCRQSR